MYSLEYTNKDYKNNNRKCNYLVIGKRNKIYLNKNIGGKLIGFMTY